MPPRLPASGFKTLIAQTPRSTLVAALVLAGLSTSPSVFALDLSSAAREALTFDSTFLAAKSKANADATKAAQGRGQLLPAANATAGRTRSGLNVVGADLTGSATDPDFSGRMANSYSLTLTQPLFRLDRYALYQQGQELSKKGEADFGQARVDVLLRVTQAYFDVLIAQDNLASVNAELKAIGEQLESAKRAFEVGSATVTDQQEAQARFDLSTANQIGAQNELEVKRNLLAQLVGKPLPERLMGLRTAVNLKAPEPLDASKWIEQARSWSFRVQSAQASAEIARREVDRVIAADNLPAVDLVAQRVRSDPYRLATASGDYADSTTVKIEMTLPLFNGGIALNKAKEVAALREKSDFDLETEKRNAEQLARTSYLGVLSGLTRVKAFEAAERSSKLALESNLLGYEVGVRINIDVLNAQQQLFATQRDLSKARYETLLNSLKLKGAVGTLSQADIDDINALLSK